MADYFAPDTRRPFSRDNRFGRRREPAVYVPKDPKNTEFYRILQKG
jgi:hypothetical protein